MYKEEWEGVVYDPSLPDGRDSCVLKVVASTVRCKATSGAEFTLDLRDATVSLGGTSNTLMFIKPKSSSVTTSFSTRDTSISSALIETGIPDIIDAVKDFQTKKTYWYTWLVASVALVATSVLGTLVGFYFYGASIVVSVLPYSVDKKLGELVFNSQLESFPIEENEEVNAAILKMTTRLASNLKDSPFEYDVRVVKSETINALALPGGKIIIFTGLINAADSPGEVAGVIAHEIAHIEERHGLKKVVHTIGMGSLLWGFFGDNSYIINRIMSQSNRLLQLSFSRDAEVEADLEGLKILVDAQIHPEGMKIFFEKLLELEKKHNVSQPEWMSTHPLTENRVQYLEEKIQELGSFEEKPFDIEWTKIKEALK